MAWSVMTTTRARDLPVICGALMLLKCGRDVRNALLVLLEP